MSTLEIGEQAGWSVRDDEPITQSSRTRVYDVPYSNLYEVEALDFQGRGHLFETRAYTKHLIVNAEDGHLSIEIGAKGHDIPTPTIPWPYHMVQNGVLFAFKRYKFEVGNEFALNYDLFDLDFKMVVILHHEDGEGHLFISSVDEWREHGRIGHSNREVQLYLDADANRVLPLDYARLLFQDDATKQWFDACCRIQERKGHK
jgi:hypothetical protein